MATTTYGTAYVQNTDLVSGWPAASLTVANRIDAVSYSGNGINAQTGTTYTLVLTDAGKNVTLSNASAVTVTIPANSSVAYPTGTVISFTNLGAGTVTISAAGGVTLNGTTLTIAQYSRSSIMKTATDTWVLTSGGGIPKATVSATTGSPTIDTVSRPGKTIYKFTGSGSITFATAGVCEILVLSGGAGGGTGGYDGYGGSGGGGGVAYDANLYATGALTVTIGAGGGSISNGNYSRLGNIVVEGGGAGGQGGNHTYSPTFASTAGSSGVTGGGGGSDTTGAARSGGSALYAGAYGFAGGASNANSGAGGQGGGGGAGGAASGTTNGVGYTSSITGSSVAYGAGGSNSAANLGGGGTGGGYASGNTKTNGNSGSSGAVFVVIG